MLTRNVKAYMRSNPPKKGLRAPDLYRVMDNFRSIDFANLQSKTQPDFDNFNADTNVILAIINI